MVSDIPAHQTHKHRSHIPCPSFGKSGFLGNSQIPDPIIIFIIFLISAHTVFWSNPENTLPDPSSRNYMGFGHTNWQRINISNRFPMIRMGLYGIIVLSVIELLLPIDFPLNSSMGRNMFSSFYIIHYIDKLFFFH